jgi:hypothetical protein
MKNLNDFKRPKQLEKTKIRSVNITQEQHVFLEKQGINLSKLVRSVLEDMMLKTKGK